MPKFILVNLYGDQLSGYPPFDTQAEAEEAVKKEWSKGWEVYIREVPNAK